MESERRKDALRRMAVKNMENLSAVEWFNRYPLGAVEAEAELERRASEQHEAHRVNPRRYWQNVLRIFRELKAQHAAT